MKLDGFNLLLAEVENYLGNWVGDVGGVLEEMESYAVSKNFPIIGRLCGNLCYQLTLLSGASNVCELGSGFGYSTVWFAMGVRDNGGGCVRHVVWDEGFSNLAKNYVEKLGLNRFVSYCVGEALEYLESQPDESFDIIFNDIDKDSYPSSFDLVRRKLKSGGLLIVDNMLWKGRIFDSSDVSSSTCGVREFSRMVMEDDGWVSNLIPIRDGLLLAYKR